MLCPLLLIRGIQKIPATIVTLFRYKRTHGKHFNHAHRMARFESEAKIVVRRMVRDDDDKDVNVSLNRGEYTLTAEEKRLWTKKHLDLGKYLDADIIV